MCFFGIKIDQNFLLNPHISLNKKNPFWKKIDRDGFFSCDSVYGFHKIVCLFLVISHLLEKSETSSRIAPYSWIRKFWLLVQCQEIIILFVIRTNCLFTLKAKIDPITTVASSSSSLITFVVSPTLSKISKVWGVCISLVSIKRCPPGASQSNASSATLRWMSSPSSPPSRATFGSYRRASWGSSLIAWWERKVHLQLGCSHDL